MPGTIRIDLRNAKGVRATLDPKLVVREVSTAIGQSGLAAQRVAKEGIPRDTSSLSRALTLETKPLQARLYFNRDLIYAHVMESGRRVGAPMPPPLALAGWARRKGFEGSLYVLARSISRRGIKGRFFMKAAREAGEQSMIKELKLASKRVEKQWQRVGRGLR